jgi:hypothetical protein
MDVTSICAGLNTPDLAKKHVVELQVLVGGLTLFGRHCV